MRKLLTILFVCLLQNIVFATNYYVSSSGGNDANAGTSNITAWQTLSKVNSTTMYPGDRIFFLRGDAWYGSLTISQSGSSGAGNDIMYSSYGNGADPKPIITGLSTVTGWTNLGGNIWQSNSAVSTLATVNTVIINGVNTPMGRYPNSGWNTIGAGPTKTSIYDASLDATNWTGAEVVIKMLTYVVDRFTITSETSKTLNFTNTNYTPVSGWGYFIQNSLSTLDVQNEWYYNPSTKKLDIYSTTSPTNVQVSSVDVITDLHYKNYITFDHIDFEGANNKAIFIGSSYGVTAQYCNFNNIGWTAIYGENYAAGKLSYNMNITNCSFNNNPQGIKLTDYFHQAYIANNTFKNTGLVYGSWQNEETQACAVISSGDSSIMEYNNIDSTGFIGVYFVGDDVDVRYNYITNSVMTLDDAGGIYTVGYPPGSRRKVYNNIVMNNAGNKTGTPNSHSIAFGIYMDDYSANVEIYNNTIENCTNGGIYLHNADSMNIHDNLSYNNGNYGQIFLDGGVSGGGHPMLRGVKVKNNIFFSFNSPQRGASYRAPDLTTLQSYGVIDSNYYPRPIDGNANIDAVVSGSDNFKTLSQWQTYSGFDLHSFNTPKTVTSTDSLTFVYNATSSSATQSLPYNYIDAKGISYNRTITLAPYSSAALIYSGAATIPPPVTGGIIWKGKIKATNL